MIEWNKINSVFLDLDGTLLDLHFDNHFWKEHMPIRYAQHHDLEHAEAKLKLNEKYSAVYGSLSWYSVDYWTQELDMDIASLKKEVAAKISVRPKVEEFLEFLHMQGKRVVLVTNAHPASIAIKMDKTRLDRFFNRIITSHELGHAKEAADFWTLLQQKETFDIKKTLFIDDNFDVLDAAKEYGIEYLLAIKKPDSQGEEKEHEHYPLLDCFDQIID